LREAVDLFVKGLPPNERGIQVIAPVGDMGPRVRADAGRVIQVLIDLLNNAHQAITSMRAVGRIELRTEENHEGNGWVKVQVIDDGPGIPELHLGRLFEPFFTTREQGTGYGLYLASEIMKEQGGRLSASNNEGGGACFTIWLPEEPFRDLTAPLPESAPA
jgi:signal transduction histidine kinase